jgi:WD40 repeat protein
MKSAIRATSEPGIGPPTANPREVVPSEQGDDQAQGQPLSADIFISYSRKDIAFARLIRASLQSSGLDTWIDWDRIPVGERWWDEICQAIERTHIFMFIISGSSMGSPVCRDEINQALKNHKRIIPILVDHLAPEAVHKFVPELPELNWVIFEKDHLFQIAENQQAQSGPPEDRLVALPKLPQFEQAMARLSEAIHTDWDWVKSHTQLQVDALRWSNKGRDASYLLRGSALEDAEGWLSRAGGHDPQPTLLQSQFITASRLEETRRQRENSRRQRRLLWVIGGALVITAVLGGVALIQRNEADYQRNQAQLQQAEAQTQRDAAQAQRDEAQRQATAALSGELAAESTSYLNSQFDVGMLLAAESWNTLDSYTSRNALLSALQTRPRLDGVMWTQHQLSDLAYSPDGKLIAGSYCAETDPVSNDCFDNEVGIWTNPDFKPSGTSLAGQKGPLAFTADGQGLITHNSRGEFVVWNLALRQIQGPTFSGLTQYGVSLVLNPEGTVLAAGGCHMYSNGYCPGSQAVVWDFASGRILSRSTDANVTGQTGLAFSPDGRTLASGGCTISGKDKNGDAACSQGSVITWDPASGQTVAHAIPSDSAVVSVAFSPDGTTLAALDNSGTVALLDTGSWKQTASWKGPSTFSPNLTYGHDGATLAVQSSIIEPVTLLNGHDATQIDQFSVGSQVQQADSVALNPGQDTLAVAACYEPAGFICEQGVVLIWDIGIQPAPARTYTTTTGHGYLSPSGTRLARTTCVREIQVNDLNKRCVEARVDVIDVATGKPAGQPMTGLTSDVSQAAFDQAADRLVTISCSGWDSAAIQYCTDTHVDVWDVASGTRIRPTLISHDQTLYLIALAPDGRTLMLVGQTVERWDLVSGHMAADSLGVPEKAFIDAMAFSPDGKRLAVEDCAEHPNFQDLSCSRSETRIWSTDTWTVLGDPTVLTPNLARAPTLNVTALQFSPDESQLAFATSQGVRFLDLANGRLSDILIQAAGSIAYSHDGKMLLAGNALWDLGVMQPLGNPFVGSGNVSPVLFGPDDKTLVSDAGLVWDIDPAVWKARVCSTAHRDLTASEWSKYVGTEAYHATCGFPTGPTEPAPAPTASPAASPFSPTGSLATARAGHTATLLLDGRVLIAGGRVGALDWIASAELYDPKTGTFTPTGSMSAARFRHTATLLPDGRVLIAGGMGAKAGASAELYDPTTGTFSPTGTMASSRYNHSATLLSDGRVLIAGGEGSGTLTSAELYDPKTGAFSPTGSMSTGRLGQDATLLSGGRVLIAGGSSDKPKVFASAELYDPKRGKFSPTGSMTTAREFYTLTRLPDGRVLAVGGEDALNTPLDSAELYDPTTGEFSPTGSLSDTWEYHAATLLSDGRVLIAGGLQNSMAVPVASAELYDPKTGMFSSTGSMAAGRQGHTATLLADGRVLIVGGSSKGSVIGSAELFRP